MISLPSAEPRGSKKKNSFLPRGYASLFDPALIDLPPNVDQPAAGEPANRRLGIAAQLAEGLSIEEWRRVWAAHLGLTHLADSVVGRVLSALNTTEEEDDTLVLFTTDHGDHLGQHRMYQKMEMYEQAIRIPLILQGPGIGVRICDTPVSHLDLMPTLLDHLGLESPGSLDGISLQPYLEAGTPLPERPIFSQYSGNPISGDLRRAVITRRHKYVYDPNDRPELYDLETDPLEMHNIAADQPALTSQLHQECKSWGESHGDGVKF